VLVAGQVRWVRLPPDLLGVPASSRGRLNARFPHTHEDTATLTGALIREPGQNLEHLRQTMRRLGGYHQVYGFAAEMIEGDPETGGLLARNLKSALYYPSMRGLRC
jgi:hypothetical protein